MPLTLVPDMPNPFKNTTTAPTHLQFSLCTEITGLPACNNTMGTVILTVAAFNVTPPDQTFNITIPGNQKAGLTRLVAGRLTADVNVTFRVSSVCANTFFKKGSDRVIDKTMTFVYLGSRT